MEMLLKSVYHSLMIHFVFANLIFLPINAHAQGGLTYTDENGQKVIRHIGRDGIWLKDGLLNNDVVLVMGILSGPSDGSETTINLGTFPSEEGGQKKEIKLTLLFDRTIRVQNQFMNQVRLNQEERTVGDGTLNYAKGQQALNEALRKDPHLSREKQRQVYWNGVLSSGEVVCTKSMGVVLNLADIPNNQKVVYQTFYEVKNFKEGNSVLNGEVRFQTLVGDGTTTALAGEKVGLYVMANIM